MTAKQIERIISEILEFYNEAKVVEFVVAYKHGTGQEWTEKFRKEHRIIEQCPYCQSHDIGFCRDFATSCKSCYETFVVDKSHWPEPESNIPKSKGKINLAFQ